MGSRPRCSDSLSESLLLGRAATPTLAVRRFDRGSGHVGLGYAVCPVGTAWVGKRSCRSELRALSSCPIRCVISPKWAIPPPIWPTLEAPSVASSSDAPGGGEYAIISESIEPSGTSMPSLKYASLARAVCSPVNLRYRTRSSRCAARRFRVSRRRSRKLVGQAIDNASRCGVTSCWQKLLTSCNRRSTKSRWDRASLAAGEQQVLLDVGAAQSPAGSKESAHSRTAPPVESSPSRTPVRHLVSRPASPEALKGTHLRRPGTPVWRLQVLARSSGRVLGSLALSCCPSATSSSLRYEYCARG